MCDVIDWLFMYTGHADGIPHRINTKMQFRKLAKLHVQKGHLTQTKVILMNQKSKLLVSKLYIKGLIYLFIYFVYIEHICPLLCC